MWGPGLFRWVGRGRRVRFDLPVCSQPVQPVYVVPIVLCLHLSPPPLQAPRISIDGHHDMTDTGHANQPVGSDLICWVWADKGRTPSPRLDIYQMTPLFLLEA